MKKEKISASSEILKREFFIDLFISKEKWNNSQLSG